MQLDYCVLAFLSCLVGFLHPSEAQQAHQGPLQCWEVAHDASGIYYAVHTLLQ